MTEPSLSLVVPLVHMRGDTVENLRAWTDQQTLARDRYQVVVAADGSAPSLEARVADVLAPHDALVRAPDRGEMDLYNVGAERATADWLVLSEAHCIPDPECLAAVAAGIEADPTLEAAQLVVGDHDCPTPFSDMLADWFDVIFDQWNRPGEWTHLSFFGTAIRRHLYLDIAKVCDRYGLFSASLMSASLDARGARMARFADAQVVHIADEDIQEHHAHTASYARGECAARADHDPRFCERYFGYPEAWGNRSRYRPEIARVAARALATAVARATLRNRADVGWLVHELAGWLPSAVAGARLRAVCERLAVSVDEYVVGRSPLSRPHRWRRFVRAHRRVADLARLEWAAEAAQRPQTGLEHGTRLRAEEFDGEVMVGAQALERKDERWYRWTGPSLAVQVMAGPGSRLVLDTGGMRGAPLSYVTDIVVGSRRIPRRELNGDDRRLEVRIPPAPRGREQSTQVTVACRPIEAAQRAPGDDRRLGLPVYAVELVPC
jgi:hypothetical protein